MLFWKILASFLFYITLPFYYLERVIHKKSGGWNEKFGFCEENNTDKKTVMIHGCSVGETLAAENLVKCMRKEFPDYEIVYTTSTITGQEVAEKKFEGIADIITYFPFDIPSCVNRFLERIKPSVVLIVETEIWPCFSCGCKEKNIPLFIINGRISDSSYNSYRIAKPFFKSVFQNYSAIYSQSKEDTRKFVSIGVDESKVEFMGNLKFGITKKDCEINLNQDGYRVLIAGSTHKKENKIVLETFKKLKNEFKDLKLIIAPRHLERVKDIILLCGRYGLNYGLRSNNDVFSEEKEVIILDTLGELGKMYSICDIAFIGGSFNKTGGHNPLEAVVYEKPAISGPCIFNFKDCYSILENANAGKVVANQNELYSYTKKLLEDREFYLKVKSSCAKVFEEQKGAIDFTLNKLKEVLG